MLHFKTTMRALKAAALVTAAVLPSFAAAETITVPLATWGGANHVGVRHFTPAFEAALERNAAGRFELQHFPGGQLAQDRDMPLSIPTGQVKMGWITVNGWTGTVTDTRIMDAPTGLTIEGLAELTDKPGGILEILQKGFAERNTVLVGVADLGPPAIVSRVSIKKPEDFRGLRVRVFSEGQAAAVTAFGGTPVTIPFAEVYSAVQFGTVDAAILGFQGIDSQRMHEVSEFALVPASFLGTTMMGWAVNAPWFEEMSADDQTAFLKAADEASRENRAEIIREIDTLSEQYRGQGMELTILSPDMPEYAAWLEATKPLLEASLSELSPELADLVRQAN